MLAPLAPRTPSHLTIHGRGTYRIRRPYWSFGLRFDVYDMTGALVAHVRHPFLRLREEFLVYTDQSKAHPLAKIQARQIIGVNIVYDISDPASGIFLGSLRKHGFRALVRDTWDILEPHGERAIGIVEEQGSSLLRRFIPLLLGRWRIEYRGRHVGRIQQVFRFFVKEFILELDVGDSGMDPRFGIASALLALTAETRREG